MLPYYISFSRKINPVFYLISCQAFKFVTVARSKRFASPKDYRIRGLRSFPNLDAQQLMKNGDLSGEKTPETYH
jgi:hypothetical protein